MIRYTNDVPPRVDRKAWLTVDSNLEGWNTIKTLANEIDRLQIALADALERAAFYAAKLDAAPNGCDDGIFDAVMKKLP